MTMRPTRARKEPMDLAMALPKDNRVWPVMTAPATTQMAVAGRGSTSQKTRMMYRSNGERPSRPHQRLKL